MLRTCIKGSGQIADENYNAGMSWLIPASADPFHISGNESEWILSYTAAVHAGL
jgi:mannose-6-phosphate isomerase class I